MPLSVRAGVWGRCWRWVQVQRSSMMCGMFKIMGAKVRLLFLVSPFTAFFAFVWHLWLTLSVSSCTMLLQEVSQICLALH